MYVHGASAFERADDRGAPSLAEGVSITVIVLGLLLASEPAACSHRDHHSAILRETIMIAAGPAGFLLWHNLCGGGQRRR